MIWGLITALIALTADQISKYYVADIILANKAGIVCTPFFNLVRMWNTGVSFSMFNDWGKTGAIILSVFASLVVLVLLYWMYKEKNKAVQIALGLIAGGAVGNIIDRVRFGAVFDFLDFHIGESRWPAFNLADSFICIGAVFIVFISLLHKSNEEKES